MGPAVIVHSDPGRGASLVEALRGGRRDPLAIREADLEATLRDARPEVVVVGSARGSQVVELCRRVRSLLPEVPCIAVTDDVSPEPAFDAVRAGASDYLPGELDPEALVSAVYRVTRENELRAMLERLESSPPKRGHADLLGESSSIREVVDRVARLAESDTTVLILGDTGTGKEVVARALHEASPRREGPFVAVDCAAIPAELLESELFGHEKGAFTGADRRRRGLLEQAHGGTLMLDELACMPHALQAKLLRALQQRTVRRVGGSQEIAFDTRVVAATNANLEGEVSEGRFRADLLYRLDVVRIELPPLRERGWDVLLLAQTFLNEEATRSGKPVRGITRGAAERLLAYDWPGNVRELRACMQHAVVLARWDRITELDLPARIGPRYRERRTSMPSEDKVPLRLVECAHLARVMRDARGNKSLAARILGIDRKTLYRKLDEHGLEELAEEGRSGRSTSRLQALGGMRADETRPDTGPTEA